MNKKIPISITEEYKECLKISKIFCDFYFEKDILKKNKIFNDKILPLFTGMLLEYAKDDLNRIQNVLNLCNPTRKLEEFVKDAIYAELESCSFNGYINTIENYYLTTPSKYMEYISPENRVKPYVTKKAIITTSANPFHYGHLDLYNKACEIFSEVKVVIAQNSDKAKANNLKAHMDVYNIPYEIIENQTIADYCKENEIRYIVRGIRNGVDAEYELKMDFVNKKINPDVQTIFIPTDDTYSNISSSTIRELLKYQKYDIAKEFMNEEAMIRYVQDQHLDDKLSLKKMVKDFEKRMEEGY